VSDSNAISLSTKLALASNEIQESQDAYRDLEAKYDRMSRERQELEDIIIRERKETGNTISDLQKQLAREKEVTYHTLT
jgi:molybdopterin converting factor small subunit